MTYKYIIDAIQESVRRSGELGLRGVAMDFHSTVPTVRGPGDGGVKHTMAAAVLLFEKVEQNSVKINNAPINLCWPRLEDRDNMEANERLTKIQQLGAHAHMMTPPRWLDKVVPPSGRGYSYLADSRAGPWGRHTLQALGGRRGGGSGGHRV